jgi:hypothetical protein
MVSVGADGHGIIEAMVSEHLSAVLGRMSLDERERVSGAIMEKKLWYDHLVRTVPSPATRTKIFHATADAMIREEVERVPWGKEITCRMKCHHCCELKVMLTRDEGELLKSAGGIHPVGDGTACRFLRNDLCGVYADRPLSCRKYFSMDTPAVLSPWVDSQWFTETDRERGTETHAVCSKIARGIWVPKHKLYQGYIDSFKNWYETMVEQALYVDGWAWDSLTKTWQKVGPLVSESFKFQGTPDFIGKLKGEIALAIPDWKTSISKQKVWKLQVSGAYRILAEENNYKPIGRCISLRLDKNGGDAKAEDLGHPIHQAYFLRALDLWRFFNG